MNALYTLIFTPTFSLSLLIESELQPRCLSSRAASFVLISRTYLLIDDAGGLRSALEGELLARGGEGEAISAAVLRRVDHCVGEEKEKNLLRVSTTDRDTENDHDHEALLVALAYSASISPTDFTYSLLSQCVKRVLLSYAIIDRTVERSLAHFATDGSQDHLLHDLWKRYRAEDDVLKEGGLVTKRWQEIGFQNTSPTTDFRGVGLLALDCLLYFAKENDIRAVEMVKESVDGGLNWYPFALASIHMTAFVLDLAVSRDLQLLLLRALQTLPSSDAEEAEGISLEPLLRIHSQLLLLFHAHWLENKFSVMQFEQVSKEFQSSLRPWIRRGMITSRALGWSSSSSSDENSFKED